MIGIYRIYNIVTDRSYIGSSIDIEKRWKFHKSKFNTGKNQKPMQQDYNRYGKDSFVYEILEETNIEDLPNKEKYYTDIYANGSSKIYNLHDSYSFKQRRSYINSKLPPDMKIVEFNISLRSWEFDAVEHMAEENQISRSNWIRDAVLEKLEREGNNKVLEGK